MENSFLVVSDKTTTLREWKDSETPDTTIRDVLIIVRVDEKTSYPLFARTYSSYTWSTTLHLGYPEEYPNNGTNADLHGFELIYFRGQTFEEARECIENFCETMFRPSEKRKYFVLNDFVERRGSSGKRLYQREHYFHGNTWIKAVISFSEEEKAEALTFSRLGRIDKYWKWHEISCEAYEDEASMIQKARILTTLTEFSV